MKKKALSDGEIFFLNDKYLLLSDFFRLPPDRKFELDLGCGSGDFSVALAQLHPERIVFAADILLNRVRKVIRKAKHEGVNNLYFLRVEARHLVSIILPDACLDRVHLLCPDPWPKHHHKGHRLISSDFTAQLHRVLKPDGIFHFSTDDRHYLAAASGNLNSSGLFEPAGPDAIEDVAGLRTEFEQQWLNAGKSVAHVVWKKKPFPV